MGTSRKEARAMESVHRHPVIGLVVLTGAWLALGCESLDTNEPLPGTESTKLEPAGVSRFPDVPVPVGFTLVEKDSVDYTNTSTRFACHQLVGDAAKQQVVQFYVEKLELSNWSWLADTSVAGERTLLFEKKDEWCQITLKRDGRRTKLRLWLMTVKPSPGVRKR